MADAPAGVRGHRGGTVDVSPVVCDITNDSYSGMFLYMQRISLVSSFAASLFLGDYAAVDFSDGTIFIKTLCLLITSPVQVTPAENMSSFYMASY